MQVCLTCKMVESRAAKATRIQFDLPCIPASITAAIIPGDVCIIDQDKPGVREDHTMSAAK